MNARPDPIIFISLSLLFPFTLSNNYNKNKVWYTLIPHRIFGVATGYNSNSFISGLGNAAGFDMPTPASTGANTPGYQNPVPASRYR